MLKKIAFSIFIAISIIHRISLRLVVWLLLVFFQCVCGSLVEFVDDACTNAGCSLRSDSSTSAGFSIITWKQWEDSKCWECKYFLPENSLHSSSIIRGMIQLWSYLDTNFHKRWKFILNCSCNLFEKFPDMLWAFAAWLFSGLWWRMKCELKLTVGIAYVHLILSASWQPA